MTFEMRKTLLIMGGFCIAFILMEELLNSGMVSRRISNSLITESGAGLATDGLVDGSPQHRLEEVHAPEDQADILARDKEAKRRERVVRKGDRKNAEKKKRRKSRVNDEGGGENGGEEKREERLEEKQEARYEERSRKEEEQSFTVKENSDEEAERVEEEERRRSEEHVQEVLRFKQERDREREKKRAEKEKKKKEAVEKVLEDSDEDDDVDSDVEDEKKPQVSDNGEADNEGGDNSDEADNDGEETDEMEKERLERSPYIVHPEEEQKLDFNYPLMTEIKLISEWKRQVPYKHSFERCRYNMCRWEPDNELADAVLFRAAAIRTWIIEPFRRKSGQRWIMYTNDPAIKSYGLERDDVGYNINATTTYQLHSDYPRLFGKLRRVKPPKKDYGKIFDGKQRHIAWFVSHCSTWSKRELYIERMRKIIPVDVFGACGNLTCGASHFRGNDSNVCLPMLSERYKFYLAFENSFCKDYVSEKFFKLFQGVDVIPVVQGGFDYHKYMPSNIFIDSSDFQSPEELAEFLLDLSEDKYRYVKMLKRKAKWTYKAAEPMHCVVCEKAHTDTRTHFHTDMVAAFNGRPSECYKPRWMKEEGEEGAEEGAGGEKRPDAE